EQLRIAREEIKKVRGGQFTDELRARERVLRRLQYVDSYGQITAKGRIACEISAADEILLTEMILSGVFKEMQPPDAAALLSCFVFEE
ncbi:UNVERIFIED_CONTAM: Exosome RNA helicase MTR4, partial [Eudyptes robustus]